MFVVRVKLHFGMFVVIEAEHVDLHRIAEKPIQVGHWKTVTQKPWANLVFGIDATGDQIEHDVTTVHPQGYVFHHALEQIGFFAARFRLRCRMFQRVAQNDFHIRHGFAKRADRTARRLRNARKNCHVARQPATIRRPDTNVATKERGDERFVDRTN
jgi:hypothetical protein